MIQWLNDGIENLIWWPLSTEIFYLDPERVEQKKYICINTHAYNLLTVTAQALVCELEFMFPKTWKTKRSDA